MGTDELLAACDAALLRSKRQGKGRVTARRASSPGPAAALRRAARRRELASDSARLRAVL